MSRRLRHPRLVLSVRIILYGAAAAVLGGLLLAGVTYLGLLAAVSAVAALLNGGTGGAALPLALVGVTVFGSLAGAVVWLVRRVDRHLLDFDRRPDPLESLKRRYVESDIDEIELERRLERLLEDSPERPSGLTSVEVRSLETDAEP